MTAETLLCALEGDAMSRLRWRVLSFFRVPPGCADDMALSDGDALWAAANMVLDARRAGAERPGPEGADAAFDEARFHELKEAGHGA